MSAARNAPDPDAEAEVDLGRYGHALLARWWLLLAGLVLGAVVGYLTTLGGTQFYRAQAVVYMGQPLGAGQAPLQSLNTNPSTARAIVTSESVDQPRGDEDGDAAGKDSLGHVRHRRRRAAFRSSGQTPLIQVTVKGPVRGEVARTANALARVLAFRLSSGARQKIAIYQQQSDSDDVGIKLVNEALAKSDLSTTEKILLQGRLQTLQSDKTLNAQLLIAAKTVEAARVITPAAAEKSSARNHRNSTAVGALIGLILGGIAALLWEPVMRRRER